MKKIASLLVFNCLMVGAVGAQSGAAGFFNPLSASRDGVHLYGVTVYGAYFSGGTPFGLPTVASILPSSGIPVIGGGSASFGWARTRDGESLSLSYTPSFFVSPDTSEVNLFNGAFSLNWRRKVRRFSVTTGVTAQVSSLQQMFFAANAFGLAASLPNTFSDLADAMISGKVTDAQLASMLTGVSVHLVPEQTYLYGQRILSTMATAGFGYDLTGRSSIHATVTATRIQRLSAGSGTNEASSTIPQTTAGSVSLGWGYALSPRTHLGLDASANRTFSRLQDGYASNIQLSMGRTMSEHWFVQGRAGVGRMTYVRQTFATPRNLQYTVGGGIGYKLRSHSLIASADRSLADSYGLGSSSTDSVMVGWVFKAPGSSWSLSANYGYQRLNDSILRGYESWRATGGIARALNQHMFISMQYAYFTSPAGLVGLSGITGAENAATVSLSWSPSQYR